MTHLKTLVKLVHGGKKRKRRLKPVRPSRSTELWYKEQLLAIVKFMQKEVATHLLPVLKQTAPQWEKKANDSIATILDATFERLAKSFGNINGIASRLAAEAARRAKVDVNTALTQTIKNVLSIDISGMLSTSRLAQTIDLAVSTNIGLINDLPTKYLQQIKQAVYPAVSKGVRADDIADIISRIDGVTESRAKLIARDQIAKMNSSINKVQQVDLGIKKYIWQTSGDERVRPTHAEHDGKTFEWEDPPEDTGNPGDDIQCRCVAIPIFDLDDE